MKGFSKLILSFILALAGWGIINYALDPAQNFDQTTRWGGVVGGASAIALAFWLALDAIEQMNEE